MLADKAVVTTPHGGLFFRSFGCVTGLTGDRFWITDSIRTERHRWTAADAAQLPTESLPEGDLQSGQQRSGEEGSEMRCVSISRIAGTQTQGAATFMKSERMFRLRKQDGLWSIGLRDCNLAAFGLDSPLADEERFRIQLDFLLSRTEAEIR